MSNIIGPDDPERLMWEMSLGELLDAAVRRDPDKVFVEMLGEAVTYLQFQQAVARTASMFKALGVNPGDRVCLYLPNCLEFLSCWFGLSYLGAVSVPINTAYKRDEAAYILNNAGAVALVAHYSLADIAGAAAALAERLRHKLIVGGESDQSWSSFSKAVSNVTPLDTPTDVSPQAVSMLGYTSGTTGEPKGVKVSHLMYVAAGQGFAHWTQATSADRFFTCLPSFHANAQYYSIMGTAGERRHPGGSRAIQRFSFLGAGERSESYRGQLYRHDDAGAGQAGCRTGGWGKQCTSVLWFTCLRSRFSEGFRGKIRHRHHYWIRDDGNVLRHH